MSRFRDFDAARAAAQSDPMTFMLGGEMFSTSGELPAGIVLDLGRAMANGDDLAAFGLFTEFFEAIVAGEDQVRFAAAVRKVGMTTVLALVQWIVEEQTGRPLTSASPSPVGLSTNGDRSTGASPPLDWTP